MTQDFLLGQLRIIAMMLIAYATGRRWLTSADASAIEQILTPIGLLAGPWIWSIWKNVNGKVVPGDTVSVQPIGTSGITPNVGDHVSIAGTTVGKVVGALLLGFILFTPLSAHAQTTKPAGACSLQTFVNLFKSNAADPVAFLTTLSTGIKTCGAKDARMALDDATANKDAEAIACLQPINDIVAAIAADDGNGGVLYKAQKFRDARKSGLVTACTNYFNSTFGAFR